MKFESDTEIDRLLRRQARRKATAAPAIEEHARRAGEDESAALPGAGGLHLDADEMNAYAEGALSDATRLRYASHLADCDECRQLVTKLTLAANVPPVSNTDHAKETVAPSRSWREWLAALFAPPMLRYGVPALALTAVIVVALVAMRGRRNTDLVAQNEQSQNTSATSQIAREERQAHTPSTGTADAPVGETSQNANSGAVVNNSPQVNPAASPTAQPKGGEADQYRPMPQNEPKPAEPQQPASGGVIGNTTADSSERDEAVEMAKTQPPSPPVTTTAPAAKAPAEAEVTTTEEITQRSVGGLGRNKTATPARSTQNNNYATDGVESRAQNDKKREAENGRREGPAARRSRSADRQASTEAAGRAYKDDGTAETRSAGGRQFRRQGGAWVDTAYHSSRSTINVARGSEQYRALVADEPGIASIADQLGGTVILVWKKRAYRIY
ncbi:MAG TPA: zf-HC2 domain-containing protein [Pyrinomonadaceae bacterium]|jgi:hypothetical protein